MEKPDGKVDYKLDPRSGVPFYKQIILQTEMAIADRRLSSGDQLPTVRSLAVELRINPNTVARAYSLLEARGVVTTQQGTGTFVSEKRIQVSEVERERVLSELTRHAVTQAGAYGLGVADLIRSLQELER